MINPNRLKFNNQRKSYPFIALLIITYLLFLNVLRLKTGIFESVSLPSVPGVGIIAYDLDNINIFISTILKILFFAFPLIAITIVEFFMVKGDFRRRYLSTSISRMFVQDGNNFADVWYNALSILNGKLPFIILISTLGLSHASDTISNSFSSFYSSLIGENLGKINSTLFFIFILLLKDFMSYLKHFIEHKTPVFWDFHECHHSATEMTLINEQRNVPLGQILIVPILLPITAFTGLVINYYIQQNFYLPLLIYVSWTTFEAFQAYVGHSSFKVIFPKPLSYIFMSPSLHWIHHSDNPAHYDKNFGTSLPYWDRLFGTYLGEEHLKDITGFGLGSTDYNKYHPLYCYSILPMKKFSRRLRIAFQTKSLLSLVSPKYI